VRRLTSSSDQRCSASFGSNCVLSCQPTAAPCNARANNRSALRVVGPSEVVSILSQYVNLARLCGANGSRNWPACYCSQASFRHHRNYPFSPWLKRRAGSSSKALNLMFLMTSASIDRRNCRLSPSGGLRPFKLAFFSVTAGNHPNLRSRRPNSSHELIWPASAIA
jgi:hypothetical protein